jgi:hypothetical protein
MQPDHHIQQEFGHLQSCKRMFHMYEIDILGELIDHHLNTVKSLKVGQTFYKLGRCLANSHQALVKVVRVQQGAIIHV